MPIDPNRAAFVKNEYRYQDAEDTSILTTYPRAREATLDTNLGATDAAALAAAYFDQEKTQKLTYEVNIEHQFMLEDFVGAPPQFTCSFPNAGIENRTMKVVSVDIDYYTGRSVVRVRG